MEIFGPSGTKFCPKTPEISLLAKNSPKTPEIWPKLTKSRANFDSFQIGNLQFFFTFLDSEFEKYFLSCFSSNLQVLYYRKVVKYFSKKFLDIF